MRGRLHQIRAARLNGDLAREAVTGRESAAPANGRARGKESPGRGRRRLT